MAATDGARHQGHDVAPLVSLGPLSVDREVGVRRFRGGVAGSGGKLPGALGELRPDTLEPRALSACLRAAGHHRCGQPRSAIGSERDQRGYDERSRPERRPVALRLGSAPGEAQAAKENDYASMEMLQWFIKEQVEEEKNASLILDQLKMVGDKGSSLVMLDHRIGKRGE